MADKFADWKQRGQSAADYREKLALVQEVAASSTAPERLKASALQAVFAINDFLKWGTEADRHRAEYRFILFTNEL